MSVEKASPQSEFDVPARFVPAIRAVEALAAETRYLAALVFGSVAEGSATTDSDLDVRVVVDLENPCRNINHPCIGGVKLDITFLSRRQLEQQIEEETRDGRRPPMITGGLVLFDKTGSIAELKARADAVRPPAYDPAAIQFDQFMLYHANDKVERSLSSDPESSLYSMHATVGSVVEIHYRANARHWVSSKKLLADLEEWDADLASLLRRFVAVANVQGKFALWTRIIDHVAASFGGRQPIEENLCGCSICVADLNSLQAAATASAPIQEARGQARPQHTVAMSTRE
jgi:hypothetical protein